MVVGRYLFCAELIPFKLLGLEWDLVSAVYEVSKDHVWNLYGVRMREVNNRYQMFSIKYENENKMVDLSSLPTSLKTAYKSSKCCCWNLEFSQRKSTGELPHLSACWTKNGEMVLMDMAFTENIKDLFMELDDSEIEDTNDVMRMDDDTDEDK